MQLFIALAVGDTLLSHDFEIGNNLRIRPKQFPQLPWEVEHRDGEHVLPMSACRVHALPSGLLRAACPASGADVAQYSHVPGHHVAQCCTAPWRTDQQAGWHFIVHVSQTVFLGFSLKFAKMLK